MGTAKSPVALRLGRQELAFGEQRLLGHLAWVNTGRVWDAARATLRSKPVQVDVFAASLVRFLPDAFLPDNLHPAAKGYDIWGQAVQAKLAELMR